MRKIRWAALLMAAVLLLSGCQKNDPGTLTYETMFEKTEASLKEGHLFFAGKVLQVDQRAELITYYDGETPANTFYTVEVVEDYFDLLPDRNLTVCIMGTTDQFSTRTDLKAEEVYIFDCTVWMQGEEVVLLLPTFYNGLPCREGEFLSFTEKGVRYAVEGTYEDYKESLLALAEEQGYGPAAVMKHINDRLASAAQKDAAYFEELEFETVDADRIGATVAAANTRLQEAKNLQSTNQGVKELLK